MTATSGRMDRSTAPLSWAAKATLVLEAVLSVGALGGGLVLMIAPRGEIMPLPVSALAGSPFDTYFLPGLILFSVIGLGPLLAAVLASARHPVAPFLALVVGLGLLIWIAVEVAIIGYSNEPPLQAIYAALGVAILLVSTQWLREVNSDGRSSAAPLRWRNIPRSRPGH